MILRFDVQASLPETRLFLSAQTALLSSSFSVFTVLGIYNFASALQLGIFLSIDLIQPQTKTKTLDLERQQYTRKLGKLGIETQDFTDKENFWYNF